MPRQLTTADVLEVTGLTPKQLRVWIEAGVIRPQGGEGTGNFRRFSVVQTLALSHARVWALAGASTPLLRSVVEYLTGFTEKALLAEFRAGRKLLIVVPGANPTLRRYRPDDPFEYWLLDIEAQYKRVLELIAEIENRQPRKVRGRSRGLAYNEAVMST